MPSIPLPSLKWGKRKQRSQMCEIFTDDGRIVTKELDVIKSCVDDPDLGVGFLLDSDDQFFTDDQQWAQILYEKSSLPVCLIGSPGTKAEELKAVLNGIFRECHEAAKEQEYKRASKDKLLSAVQTIVAIVSSAAVIMFAIQYFGSKGA